MNVAPQYLITFVVIALNLEACRAEAPSCSPEQLNKTSGLSEYWVTVDGKRRRFVMYVPTYYNFLFRAPSQLWILAPGAFNEPEKQIRMSDMVSFAEEQQFPFVALKGDKNLMNVIKNSQPDRARVDDVAYTQAVLKRARQEICIDPMRIYCTGYSRGARFCSRLASELSGTIAAIAPVGGIRFPKPNHATRPVPIIAFHGTGDPINPFNGNGNPEYWYDSVPKAIDQWVEFNGCKQFETKKLSQNVIAERHMDCTDDADVVLIKIAHGGHTWPGSKFNFTGLGTTTHEIKANALMGAFLSEHPFPMQEKTFLQEISSSTTATILVIVIAFMLVAVAILSCLLIRAKHSGTDSSSESDSEDEDSSEK